MFMSLNFIQCMTIKLVYVFYFLLSIFLLYLFFLFLYFITVVDTSFYHLDL
ncbi:hypothetical protein IC575_015215 [Cucumis melo]